MFKMPVVALALFAALCSTQAFAQNLAVTSVDPVSGAAQVPVSVFNHGAALTSSCIEVRFYGTNLLGALRDDQPILSTTINAGALGVGQVAKISAALPWQTYASMLHLNGPLYFKTYVRWTVNSRRVMSTWSSPGQVFTIIR